MKIIETVKEFKALRRELKGPLGFIPTMGTLHSGHLKLVEKSLEDNDHTVVSIFVNPAQFNEKDDFDNYPNHFESDVEKLKEIGADILFYPNAKEIYPDDYKYKLSEKEYSLLLCGQNRPGHFDGVLTVIMKFLNIITPHKAYFGKKDYQQYLLIKKMAETFFIDTEIIGLPTVREASGLAMSSRNKRLSPEGLELAGKMNSLMKKEPELEKIRAELEEMGIEIDYLEDIENRRYIAAKVEKIRLIDNVEI